MVSKIHTNNPKHHKYVTTNKYERKKNFKTYNDSIDIVTTNNRNYFTYNTLCNFINRIKFLFYHTYHKIKYFNGLNIFINKPGCKIIYVDCNHTKYQVIKNGKYIKDKQGNIKTFKKY